MNLPFLSVCDGMGCASLAFSPLGWRQVLSSEIEAAPRAVLRHRLGAYDLRETGAGRLPLWGDMAALRVRHLRRFGIALPDLLCGGTPCQGFSVAGLRGGMSDPRGALTLTFIRLANALDAARHHGGAEPIIIFWENVPGILSMEGNPFGHVLAGLVGEDTAIKPVRGRWTGAGLAIGPRRAAAWRILDAQYFGLAQRRERLFIVASARNGFDPAAVLFESEGVRRHSPPSREAGKSVAALTAHGVGTCGADDNQGQAGHLILEAFGGNDTRGPIDLATDLNAHGGPCGRMDFESETFVTYAPNVIATLQASGAGSARTGNERSEADMLIAFSCKDHGADATADLAPTMRAMGHAESHANAGGQLAVAFALRGREDGAVPEVEGDGQKVGALRAASGGSSRDYVAFDAGAYNDIRTESLRALRRAVSATDFEEWGAGVTLAVVSPEILRARLHGGGLRCEAVQRDVLGDDALSRAQNRAGGAVLALWNAGCEGCPPRGWEPSQQLASELVSYLSGVPQQGASAQGFLQCLWLASEGLGLLREALSEVQEVWRPYEEQGQPAHSRYGVRRLTPTEAERLQGVPDGYTLVPCRGKPMADGPRYKMLGNGWAVPVISWIGQRIEAEIQFAALQPAVRVA